MTDGGTMRHARRKRRSMRSKAVELDSLDQRSGCRLDRQECRPGRADADALERDRRRARRRTGLDDQVRDGERKPVFDLQRRAAERSAGGLDRDEGAGDRAIDRFGKGRAVETLTDELSRNETLPSGSQESAAEQELTTIAPRVSPSCASVRMTFRKSAGADAAGSSSDSLTWSGKPQNSQAFELAAQPPGFAGQRPFAPDLDEDAGPLTGPSGRPDPPVLEASRAATNRAARAISWIFMTLPVCSAIVSNGRSLQTRHMTAWATPRLVP